MANTQGREGFLPMTSRCTGARRVPPTLQLAPHLPLSEFRVATTCSIKGQEAPQLPLGKRRDSTLPRPHSGLLRPRRSLSVCPKAFQKPYPSSRCAVAGSHSPGRPTGPRVLSLGVLVRREGAATVAPILVSTPRRWFNSRAPSANTITLGNAPPKHSAVAVARSSRAPDTPPPLVFGAKLDCCR